jgi:hypothetical protein
MSCTATGMRPVSVRRYAGPRMPESVLSANMPPFSRVSFFVYKTFHLLYFKIDKFGVMKIEVILIVESGRTNISIQRSTLTDKM